MWILGRLVGLWNTQLGVLSSTLCVDFGVVLNINGIAITLYDILLSSFNFRKYLLDLLFGTRRTFCRVMAIYSLGWSSSKSTRGDQRKLLELGSREVTSGGSFCNRQLTCELLNQKMRMQTLEGSEMDYTSREMDWVLPTIQTCQVLETLRPGCPL